jgi:uncharacterized membrane protein
VRGYVSPMTALLVAAIMFVATHIGLAAPRIRRALTGALGDRPFLLGYVLIAAATLIWMVRAYKTAPLVLLWSPPVWAWHVAPLLMLAAAILFLGSMNPANRALLGARGGAVSGVLRITRHPMMWAFAIWAVVHAWLGGDEATLILCAAVAVLALGGAAAQDIKKDALAGPEWAAYRRQTSFWPFGRGFAGPGWRATMLGTALLLVATWAHPYLGAPAVPPWHWPS